MQHVFHKGEKDGPILLLLHGTGGNEKDLIPLVNMIAPGASYLGVRGNVLENGMPRFFRRLAEGIFDEEDLVFRTEELSDFIDDMSQQYDFDRKNVVAVGYSNGANIAASLMYHFEDALNGAILFHAMVPMRGIQLPNLENTPVFIGAGKRDPLIPANETKELVEALRNASSIVTEHWGEGGHELTREEVEKAREWFEQNFQ
ncbi:MULTISPECIES: alpha/beta hydrolase [unclassified Bacillus (in: firmicutes)]|uniref:alpha/beta hydrolase n=1 Tax=unclassified Bacillus (in: firmicutes) TaxID=185979 RepID=UPI0008E26691|nr:MULTISPECIES: alpha/beta hydrolase [unclassified Bacillus (in: firmicutes)]SFA90811.1 phospholipase/carboxylesterase [Bacillus sp. UNCCL13]SFQ85392.1 phospholipase/carboxylesterase [Bacillus sp. cl95]